MTKHQDVPTMNPIQGSDELVNDYLSKNPQLASALATFDVAQEEYRKSVLALTSVQIVTTSTTNIEA
jgi:hypothetical protein